MVVVASARGVASPIGIKKEQALTTTSISTSSQALLLLSFETTNPVFSRHFRMPKVVLVFPAAQLFLTCFGLTGHVILLPSLKVSNHGL